MTQTTADKIALLTRWAKAARRGVAFTGAGISTASGIPDFRSKDGLWTKNKPIQFDDFLNDPRMRVETWRRKFAILPVFDAARPSAGHQAIAHLVAHGHFAHVVTQNIDNLHQASGVPDDKIIELHGNGSYALCLDCGDRYELVWMKERLAPDGTPPNCSRCDGFIKTATISFGQPMPAGAMARAHDAACAADLFLVAGSSLVVYPAAGFPVMAKRAGARLVIINREPTDLDDIADLVINDEIGTVMAPLFAPALHSK